MGKRTRAATVACVGLGLLAMPVVAAGGASAAPLAGDPSLLPTQDYYWAWTDGIDSTRRVFAESEYLVKSNLPGIKVTVRPTTPQRKVTLKYWDKVDNRWEIEDRGVTKLSNGSVVMKLNPTCGGQWCDSTWSYRLIAGAGNYKNFKITYVAD